MKNNRIYLASLMIVLLTPAGCARDKQGAEPPSGRIDSSNHFVDPTINCDEQCLKNKALLGDPIAARVLAQRSGNYDANEAQRWNLIAAENGDPVSQYNYSILLLEGDAKEDRVRATFWLTRLSKQGDKDAATLLEKIQTGAPVEEILHPSRKKSSE